ncbi:hypothetical protein ACFSQQ_10430 [Mesorhizobium kowhaii]|uniref:hypothetical protein n=1 Tax=Mesorhizobium kowhaii TaxID=1300272 RepID=UPI0035ED50A9
MGNIINFADAAGTTVSFSFSEDQLSFDGLFSAGKLTLMQLGSDVAVTCNGTTVTLAAVTIDELLDADFAFADGSVVRFDTSNQLTGSDQADYFYFRNSSSDAVTAGAADDTIVVGDHLEATDAIDGGGGNDTVTVSGSLSVALSPTTITEASGMSITSVATRCIGFRRFRIALTGRKRSHPVRSKRASVAPHISSQ